VSGVGTDWLAGRTAVVTGASRGIGRATAFALARAGCTVVLAARTTELLDAAVAELTADGLSALAVTCDVSDPAAVERLFDAAAAIGPPTVLVCAAGTLERALLEATTDDLWNDTLATNLTGAFLCCRRAFGAMREAGSGRIVNIASLSGVYATEKFPGLAAYNVSKYGVVGLTEAIAVEGRDHGIAAVCISPGAVDTEMLRRAVPGLVPGLVPDDIGRLIVALLDESLDAISGANIPLFSNR
jgi:NAD(P)-dependent dehydrogenase (short-subunit alcohol dehydrogenase family)